MDSNEISLVSVDRELLSLVEFDSDMEFVHPAGFAVARRCLRLPVCLYFSRDSLRVRGPSLPTRADFPMVISFY